MSFETDSVMTLKIGARMFLCLAMPTNMTDGHLHQIKANAEHILEKPSEVLLGCDSNEIIIQRKEISK